MILPNTVFCVLMCIDSIVHAQSLGFIWADGEFETIGFPDAVSTVVSGTNDTLEIVGGWQPSSLFQQAGFWRDAVGGFRSIETPVTIIPNDINNHGDMVGSSFGGLGNVVVHASNGVLSVSSVELPNIDVTNLRGINDVGEVVGHFVEPVEAGDGGVQLQSFHMDAHGNVHVVEIPNATNTFVGGINNKGEIGGGYLDEHRNSHGYVWKQGVLLQPIDVPGFNHTFVEDINELGDVVGWVSNSPASNRSPRSGFLYKDGEFTILQVPGSVSTEARGITLSGEVVGVFVVPEPASSARMFFWATMMLFIRRQSGIVRSAEGRGG